jgi:hypothetical protein
VHGVVANAQQYFLTKKKLNNIHVKENQMKFYEIEDLIMQAWSTAEDLDLLLWSLMDRPTPMTEDEQANMIIGITALHNSRMQRLLDGYSAVLKTHDISYKGVPWELNL